MSYVIRLKEQSGVLRVHQDITEGITSSRFSARVVLAPGQGIHLEQVRLKVAKPYCGQHPGECLTGGPRKSMRYLEWDDWVEFNGLVNRILDQLGIDADVWSNPPEKLDRGRNMFVRRIALGARKRYDWAQEGQIRVWNHGTEDQFR